MAKTIRAAIFFHDTILTSGATHSMLDLVDSLVKDGRFQLTCVFPRHEGTAIDYLRDKPVSIVAARYWYCTCGLHAGRKERVKLWLKLGLSWLNTMVQIAPRLRGVDLIYTNTGVILAGAWAARRLHVPHVWHIREFLEEDHGVMPLMGRARYDRFLANNTQQAILISQALRQKYAPSFEKQRCCVIYDDLSPQYLVQPSFSWQERKHKLLMVGAICEGKGQLQVLRAAALLKKQDIYVSVTLAGAAKDRDKPYEAQLHQEVRASGMEAQVHFLGHVSDLTQVRKETGIGVVASRSEAFGRVTIEGMLAGMVMIGANAGGTAELIRHGENGYLYPLGDVEKLAGCIRQVLEAEEDEIARIRLNALEGAKRHTCGECARQVAEVCIALVEEGSR